MCMHGSYIWSALKNSVTDTLHGSLVLHVVFYRRVGRHMFTQFLWLEFLLSPSWVVMAYEHHPRERSGYGLAQHC